MDFSEEILMGQLVQGDRSAVDALYERYGANLYSAAYRIVQDRSMAEEVVQDSFVRLWQKAAQCDSERGSLLGWLLAITRHRAISRLRLDTGRNHDANASEDGLQILPRNLTPDALQECIAKEIISAALAQLTDSQKEIVTLAYFDGMTCVEIAGHKRIPLGTVKSKLRMAFKTMRAATAGAQLPSITEGASGCATLETILITGELLLRRCRKRSAQDERALIHRLAGAAAASPEHLIDCFLQMAIGLCGAGTAGLSFLETAADGTQQFRWTNLSGQLSGCVGGTTPRNFSPCGVTMDLQTPQLFSYPGRYFEYFNNVDVPIVEGLVIPFRAGEETQGTVWIVSHDKTVRFDSRDCRIMEALTEWTCCTLHLLRQAGNRSAVAANDAPGFL